MFLLEPLPDRGNPAGNFEDEIKHGLHELVEASILLDCLKETG